MRKFSKIIVIALALAIALTVGILAVSAAGDNGLSVTVALDGVDSKTEAVSELPVYNVGDYLEYEYEGWRASYRIKSVANTANGLTVTLDFGDARYYSVIGADGGETYVTKASLGNPQTTDALLVELSAKFRSDFNALPAGATIKLYADVKDNSTSALSVSVEKHFDLNGFNFVSTCDSARDGTKSAFSITSTFYLYSSRPGGSLFLGAPYASATEQKDPETNEVSYNVNISSSRGYSAFGSLSGNARVHLGKYGNFDGNNLSIYTNMMANITGSSTDGSYFLTIDGGYYHKWCTNYMPGMFYFRDNAANQEGELNVSLKNATFYSKDYLFYYYHASGSPIEGSIKTFRLDIENCVLKAENSIFMVLPHFMDRVTANIEDSYILSTLGVNGCVNIDEGCRFSGVGVNTAEWYFAKSITKMTFAFKTNTFKFYDYAYDAGRGYVTAKFDPSSMDVELNETEIFFTNVTASEENSSLITWIDENGVATTERWLNGEIPRPANALPEGNDNYYYTYGDITAVNGDKTYTARPVAKFGLKINLTLASDFIYNVYVPESASESIKEVRVYKSNGEGVVLQRGELATISGVPYYRYFFNIQASLAADAYSFDMDIYTDKASGEYFTQQCEMSIPAYSAEIIYNDKYSDSTHNLMNKVLAYVKAACDYFNTANNNKYYSVIGKIPTVTAPEYRAGVAVDTIPEGSDVRDVLGGISVIFGSQLKYRYYFKPDVDFSANTVTFSYINNGSVTVVTLKAADVQKDAIGNYYDVPLKASDMRSDVTLSVNSDSFTYNLSNYIFEVNSGNNESEKQLVYSLWEYSEAAGGFNNETPDVDVSINGTPISEYKIVANTEEELAAAEIFKSVIEKEHGISLEILSSYSGRAIEFKSVSPDSLFDYHVNLDGDNLVISCAYRSFFEDATDAFVNDTFANINRDLDITAEFVKDYFYGKILYSDFDVPTFNGTAEQFKGMSAAAIDAAAGENAYFAIKRAHDVANSKGYSVYADKDATYFIGTSKNDKGTIETIVIKTDTYWQGADFIINDSSLSRLEGSSNSDVGGAAVFRIGSDHTAVSISPDLLLDLDENGKRPLYTTDTKLKAGLGYAAMIFVSNNDVTQYIRFGYDTKQGRAQQELILIDEYGNIDPSTPTLFDFENVTSISAYRADTKPIVIDGGEGCTVTTLSSQVILHSVSKTISRVLSVERSNTTVKNIEHVIYNEPTRYDANNTATGGHSYSGFFSVTRANNVVFEDCVAQARVRCKEGTYDISVSYANDVTYRNFTQSNFFQEGTQAPDTTDKWWVMGSNYCKNLNYDSCVLTRFDAHAGVYNATVKNSTITSIRLTGGGTFILENSTVYSRSGMGRGFIELREDYGSTWRGNIIIKDVHFSYTGTKSADFAIIRGNWEHHEFGYDTALPNVNVDTITFSDNIKSTIKNIYVFNISNAVDQSYTYFVTETVTFDGVTQSVTKKITDVFDDQTYKMLTALEDLRTEYFDGTISRTVTYDAKDSKGVVHSVTETETVNGFENVNPYKAPDLVIIKGMSDAYTCSLTKTLSKTFEETIFMLDPEDFGNSDTPIIGYVYK